LRDPGLEGPALAATILELAADPDRRARMSTAVKSLARTDAADRIAELALALAERREAARVP